jgi:hypothetical protein
MDGTFVFVRQKKSHNCLTLEGNWAADLREARQFGTTWEAMQACRTLGLCGVEVVMWFGDPMYNLVFGVNEKRPQPPSFLTPSPGLGDFPN